MSDRLRFISSGPVPASLALCEPLTIFVKRLYLCSVLLTEQDLYFVRTSANILS